MIAVAQTTASLYKMFQWRATKNRVSRTVIIMDRFSEYRIMWVLVLFDLPTETKKRKESL